MFKAVAAPLEDKTVESLKVGDTVRLSGSILVARDAAHRRMAEALQRGEELPFLLSGEVIFYAAPAPTPPGAVIGPIGPTTSGRMDKYTPLLLSRGLKGMIGKGLRSSEVLRSIRDNRAVYFGATGGTAVLLADCVKSVVLVAYEDLGPESVLRLKIENMPLVVLADSFGGDLYSIANG